MASFAQPGDIEAVWRPLSAQETTAATVRLSQASAIIRQRVPSVDERVSADADFADVVEGVCVDMVLRVLRNPEGLSSYAIDDFRGTRDATTATGELYLTGEEFARLAPPAQLAPAFTVDFWG